MARQLIICFVRRTAVFMLLAGKQSIPLVSRDEVMLPG